MGADGAATGSRDRVARRVTACGRVQGVFYRDSTRREAIRLGVAGWIRNLPDGTVEGIFEGEREPVEALIAFCRVGPERARVESLESTDVDPHGFTRFEVR